MNKYFSESSWIKGRIKYNAESQIYIYVNSLFKHKKQNHKVKGKNRLME